MRDSWSLIFDSCFPKFEMLSNMRLRHLLLLTSLLPLAACGDDLADNWTVNVDSVSLYSASRPTNLGRESAFDFSNLIPFPVETPGVTGRWDVVLTDADGTLSLVPASAFSGLDTRAAIATIGNRVLEEVESAPSDTSAYKRTAVPMQLHTVYVVRTRRVDCGFGSGVRYGKFEPIEIDPVSGFLRIRFIVNPFCNSRDLIPNNN
jgi:hypothetical protein